METIHTFDSGKKGPDLVIMGGIHGNETPGVETADYLQTILEAKIIRGKVTVILGNPTAISQNKRYIDSDLNRAWNNPNTNSTELQRAKELEPVLKNATAVLDIHSTTEPTEPFTCSANTSEHIKVATALGVKFATVGWDDYTPGMASDQFVDSQGGLGITLECGSTSDPKTIELSQQATLKFLAYFKVISEDLLQELQIIVGNTRPKVIEICKMIIPPDQNNVQWQVPIENFTYLDKDTPFIKGMNLTPEEYFSVMPMRVPNTGGDVGFFGKSIDIEINTLETMSPAEAVLLSDQIAKEIQRQSDANKMLPKGPWEILNSNGFVVFQSPESGEIYGFFEIREHVMENETVWEMGSVVCKKAGFAKTMMTEFEKKRKNRGIKKAFAMARENNIRALQFFGKNQDTIAKITPKIEGRETGGRVYFEWDGMPQFIDEDWQSYEQNHLTRIINQLGRGIPFGSPVYFKNNTAKPDDFDKNPWKYLHDIRRIEYPLDSC